MEIILTNLLPPLMLLLGGIVAGLVGLITVWFKQAQNKAQAKADVEEAQNRMMVLQKIGQVAAGYVEQTHKNDPNDVKEKLALEIGQILANKASTPVTNTDLLPHVLAGVAALPPTNPPDTSQKGMG